MSVPTTGVKSAARPESVPRAVRILPGPRLCAGCTPLVSRSEITNRPPLAEAGAWPLTSSGRSLGVGKGGFAVVADSRNRPRLCLGGEPC